MEGSAQFMEIALTAVIALAVGFTMTASSTPQSGSDKAAVRDVIDTVVQAWAPIANASQSQQLEI